MGNRAVIVGADKKRKSIAIYLHWNGGRDSVEPFLAYAKAKGVRGIDSDNAYCIARLTQIIANWMGGTLSLGVMVYDPEKDPDYSLIDPGDNGVYVVNDNFEIVDRPNYHYPEQREYKFDEFIYSIDEKQPKEDRLTPEQLENIIKEHAYEVVDKEESK